MNEYKDTKLPMGSRDCGASTYNKYRICLGRRTGSNLRKKKCFLNNAQFKMLEPVFWTFKIGETVLELLERWIDGITESTGKSAAMFASI